MKGDKIKYKDGYKHQLAEDYRVFVGITPDKFNAETEFLILDMKGVLLIKKGYAWDGASGPTWDTPTVKRASLVHDAIYQLMREEIISLKHRATADRLLKEIIIEDGGSRIRAWIWEKAVKLASLKSATCEGGRKIITVP